MKKFLTKAVLLLCFVALFAGCNKTGRVVKYLREDLNTASARWWANFVEENGIDAIDVDDETLLYRAVIDENEELVALCLKAGAEPTLQTKEYAPVIEAYRNRNAVILDLLLKAGAPIQIRTEDRTVNYDLLYLTFGTPLFPNVLPYATGEQLDYRDYRNLFAEDRSVRDITDENRSIALSLLNDNKDVKLRSGDVRRLIRWYIAGHIYYGLSEYDNKHYSEAQQDVLYSLFLKNASDEWHKANDVNFLLYMPSILSLDANRTDRYMTILNDLIVFGYEVDPVVCISRLLNGANELLSDASRLDERQKDIDEFNVRFESYKKFVTWCKEQNVDINMRMEEYRTGAVDDYDLRNGLYDRPPYYLLNSVIARCVGQKSKIAYYQSRYQEALSDLDAQEHWADLEYRQNQVNLRKADLEEAEKQYEYMFEVLAYMLEQGCTTANEKYGHFRDGIDNYLGVFSIADYNIRDNLADNGIVGYFDSTYALSINLHRAAEELGIAEQVTFVKEQ